MNKRHFLYCVFFWTLCLASWGRGAHVVTNRPNYKFSLEHPFAELKGQESEGALRADASFEEGFCLSFTADFQPDFSDGEMLAIDDVLSVSLRWQKPGENDGQNYAAFHAIPVDNEQFFQDASAGSVIDHCRNIRIPQIYRGRTLVVGQKPLITCPAPVRKNHC